MFSHLTFFINLFHSSKSNLELKAIPTFPNLKSQCNLLTPIVSEWEELPYGYSRPLFQISQHSHHESLWHEPKSFSLWELNAIVQRSGFQWEEIMIQFDVNFQRDKESCSSFGPSALEGDNKVPLLPKARCKAVEKPALNYYLKKDRLCIHITLLIILLSMKLADLYHLLCFLLLLRKYPCCDQLVVVSSLWKTDSQHMSKLL